jgi:hypothetical protein
MPSATITAALRLGKVCSVVFSPTAQYAVNKVKRFLVAVGSMMRRQRHRKPLCVSIPEATNACM